MFTNQKAYRGTIYVFAALQIVLLMSFLVILFALSEYVEAGAYVFLFGTLALVMMLVIMFRHIKNGMYNSEYRVKSIHHEINLPETFKKRFRLLLPDGRSAFYSEKGLIPTAFVATLEGRKGTLINKLEEIDKYNHYKLLYLFKKKYALIEDVWCNKHLVHVEDLEILNMIF
jgi:hypothetical protein